MINLLTVILLIFLDGLFSLITNHSIYMVNFTFIYLLFIKYKLTDNKYLCLLLLSGIIYDLLYFKIFLWNTLIFYIIYMINRNSKQNILYYLFNIFIYNILNYFIYGLTNNFTTILYPIKISIYSLISSTLYIWLLYILNNFKRN